MPYNTNPYGNVANTLLGPDYKKPYGNLFRHEMRHDPLFLLLLSP